MIWIILSPAYGPKFETDFILGERARVFGKADITDRLLADEPALLTSLDFGQFVAQGTGPGPSLLIGDASEISLMRSARVSYLDHRMAHLAKPGDVVLVRNRDKHFETYLKDHRGLQDLTFIEADPEDTDSVAKQAFTSRSVLGKLVEVTRQHGGLTITSYLTTETIWRLAQSIGEVAKCVVHVNGPSPRVSARANDKLWFTQLAKEVIGADSVPPTMSAYGPKAAAAEVISLCKEGQQVIVKVPDSAGSAGNIRLDSNVLKNLALEHVETLLMDRLHNTGWADSYPILVGVWDAHVTCSPSVQMWLPLSSDVRPTVQGVFEQRVFGEAQAFVGAVKSTLPSKLQNALVTQAVQIAQVLQRLGYYGRCSFDAVICGDDPGSVHWIECNGRWSGVSIPLAILTAVDPLRAAKGIVILQDKLPGEQIDTCQALTSLSGLLYSKGSSESGVILLSPPIGAQASTASALSFADTQGEAAQLSDMAIAALRDTD